MMANCHGPLEKAASTIQMDSGTMMQIAIAKRKMAFRF
jgi:hypothetical protein